MKSNDLDVPPAAEATEGVSRRSNSALPARRCFGLLLRRERWGLSLRGWLAAGGMAALLGVLFVLRIYPFLAVTDRKAPADCLVAEGWVPVDILRGACAEFKSGGD